MHGAGFTGFQAGRVGTGAWICPERASVLIPVGAAVLDFPPFRRRG